MLRPRQHVSSPAESADPASGSYLTAPVSAVARAPVLWADAETSVAEAARRMVAANVGSLLVRARRDAAETGPDDPEAAGPGIVTDRDLRAVVAECLGPDTTLDEIASRPLMTLSADAPVAAAHLRMLEAGVHHFAVVDPATPSDAADHGVIGIVSSSDLHLHQSQGPFFVLQQIETLPADYAALRDRAVRSLRLGGVGAERIGRITSYLDDHLVRHVLRKEIAEIEAEQGPLPAPWAWVAFGSDGRREQAVIRDQHNALVFDPADLDLDAAAAASDLYHRLATRVSERLLVCGLPESRGGFVAGRWCATLAEWRRRFHHWLDEPDAESLEHAQVFFDLRRVAGSLDDAVLQQPILDAASRPEFLRWMAAMAERRRPAVGRWRGLSTNGEGEVDLVEGGLRPLVALARVAGLATGDGTVATATVDRLAAAADAGILSRAASDQLVETFHWISDLVLDLALDSAGDPASACVRPADLGKYGRRRLKKALRFVRKQQPTVAASVARAATSRAEDSRPVDGR